MSSPGPIVMGLGLIASRSSTQIADFVRRTAEFLSIVVSFLVYNITSKEKDFDKRKKKILESRSNLFVGAVMCLAGIIMALVAVFAGSEDKGNVIPGLIIVLASGSANAVFWVKYIRLNKAQHNAIFAVQARLYGAKVFVDSSVMIALGAMLIASDSAVAYWLDFIGSLLVALYLIWSGARTVYEERFLHKSTP